MLYRISRVSIPGGFSIDRFVERSKAIANSRDLSPGSAPFCTRGQVLLQEHPTRDVLPIRLLTAGILQTVSELASSLNAASASGLSEGEGVASLATSVSDATFGQVVGSHLNCDFVTG